jgi:hypothetical protein
VQPSAARALARGLKTKDATPTTGSASSASPSGSATCCASSPAATARPEIGEKLFISPKTVDTYKQRIGEKLGLTHRSEYVQFALKLGLLAQ